MHAHQFILIWITIYDIATVLDLAFYRAAQKKQLFQWVDRHDCKKYQKSSIYISEVNDTHRI